MFLFGVHPVLIAAAVIPALVLLIYVRRADRLESESPRVLIRLVIGGIFATALALLGEEAGTFLVGLFFEENTVAYAAALFFLVVGPAEEGFKYLLLKRRTWKEPEFNCQFDGVVYAVFVSLGFALWENISYVAIYGFETALIRAVTAVPGHACFGVFMGAWYGLAKRCELYGEPKRSKVCRILSVCSAALLHGVYDFTATVDYSWFFAVFVAGLFLVSWLTIRRLSRKDRYIRPY